MEKRVLDYNPMTRETTYHYYDHATGQTHIETVQDCQNIIEKNKMEQSMGFNNARQDWFKFASVPNSVLLKWKRELNLDYMNKDDLPKIEKILMHDPEYRYLRTY